MPLYSGDPLTPGIGATKDAKRLGITRGQTVSVSSNGTSVELRAQLNKRLRAGTARVADEHARDLHPTVEVSPG